MNNDLPLARIEAILSEIERLDAATQGWCRQPSDREAFNIINRIERKMRRNQKRAIKQTA